MTGPSRPTQRGAAALTTLKWSGCRHDLTTARSELAGLPAALPPPGVVGGHPAEADGRELAINVREGREPAFTRPSP
jgi:hypothetical protein